MLWKCYIQYASKFRKLSSSHRTGHGQFSFQFQIKAMPKNAQTTAQLHSSHILAKWSSKFSKPGFNRTWPMNFEMFKLDLEKAEEAEIKLPTSVGSLKKQESFRKTSIRILKRSPVFPILLFSCISWHWLLRKALLSLPCCPLELSIQMGISVLFSFPFCFSSFHSYL